MSVQHPRKLRRAAAGRGRNLRAVSFTRLLGATLIPSHRSRPACCCFRWRWPFGQDPGLSVLRSGAGLKPVQGRAPGLSQPSPIAPCAVGPIESRSKGGSNHPNHSRSRRSFRLAVTSRKPASLSLLARPFRAGQSDFRCYRASFVCAPNTRISCETPGARMRTRCHLSDIPWRREGVSSASSGCYAAPSQLHPSRPVCLCTRSFTTPRGERVHTVSGDHVVGL